MLYLKKFLSSVIDILIIIPGLIILGNILYILTNYIYKNEDIEITVFSAICMLTLYFVNYLLNKKDSIKGNRSIGKKKHNE